LWGTYFLCRTWLTIRGELPWRLMPFLHDAHVNRGVLRQVGAVYQFRHIDLQRRIASWPENAIATITVMATDEGPQDVPPVNQVHT
jgi:hypothetical protein